VKGPRDPLWRGRGRHGVSFTVDRGEHVTLLGPSGCGKTTTLRAIAGLEQPVSGSIRIDGHAMYDASERRNIPTEQRGVSMVFQSYAVWPHMTVFDNVAYGLRVRKQSQADLKANAERALDLVQMRHLADAAPPSSRAASSSACAGPRHRLLADRRAVRRAALQPRRQAARRDAGRAARAAAPARHHLGLCHARPGGGARHLRPGDRDERRRDRADRHAEQIYNRPSSRFVADFVGLGQPDQGPRHRAGHFRGRGRHDPETAGGTSGSEVAVRTAYIDLVPQPGDNQLPGTVRQRMFHGDFVQYIVECACGRLIVRRPPVNLLDEGAPVTVSFSPEHTVLLQG
jgi:ABC-type Fe3+/spermidine/putrescine transport system ATPase subunit